MSEQLELLTVRITKKQKDYLIQQKKVTGNNPSTIIRALLDFYIELPEEDDKGETR